MRFRSKAKNSGVPPAASAVSRLEDLPPAGVGVDLRHGLRSPVGNVVRGWIFDKASPERRCSVRIVLEPRNQPPEELGVLVADRPVEIVDGEGRRRADCGFEYRVPEQWDVAMLRIFEADSGREICGSPLHLGVAPRLEGYFDGLSDNSLTGWAWGDSPEYRCDVDVLLDGVYVGTAFTVRPRDDLAAVGIGTGRHGFAWQIPDALIDDREHEVGFVYHGTARHLAQSPARLSFSRFDTHFSLGSDGILRGALVPRLGSSDGVDRLVLDVLMAGEPLCEVIASLRTVAFLPDGHNTFYAFSLPLPTSTGQLEVKIRQTGRRYPVEIISDAALPVSALEPARIDPREIERAACARAELERPPRSAKMLIPVWGERYISNFCELCLPSLLAPRNLPAFVAESELEVVVLTRQADIGLFLAAPSYQRLARLVPVRFIAIDDILTAVFDPTPQHTAAMALTHAYFRGIRSCGDRATATDLIFWNGDFVAADGTFAALAEAIRAGSRCTMAPSLRAHLGAKAELAAQIGSIKDVLSIAARPLVGIALRNLHPTTQAKIVNRAFGSIENPDRLYWQASDDVLLCHSFLPFMLHIRPEQVWDDINGFCDYAFVPEMVPHSPLGFEHYSDRICIVELQDAAREAEFLRDQPFSVSAAAKSVDYWATQEHLAASKELFIFDGRQETGEAMFDSGVRAEADAFGHLMTDIYRRLGERRQWHNDHFYWRACYQALGHALGRDVPSFHNPRPSSPTENAQPLADRAPAANADRPRSGIANRMRWTGYDLDIMKEDWNPPPANVKALFDTSLDDDGAARISRCLDDMFDGSVCSWLMDDTINVVDQNFIRLTGIGRRVDQQSIEYTHEFIGSRWGLADERDGVWYRELGPGGTSIILHRATQRTGFVLSLVGYSPERTSPGDVAVTINGHAPDGRTDQRFGPYFVITLHMSRRCVIEAAGRLIIGISDLRGRRDHGQRGSDDRRAYGFIGYHIQPDLDTELDGNDVFLALSSRDGERLPVPPWQLTAPTLENFRNHERSAAAATAVVVEAGERILGAGWGPPFDHAGELFRWLSGSGGEVTVVRLAPGRAYTVSIEASSTLSQSNLAIHCVIEVNGEPVADRRVEREGALLRIGGCIDQPLIDAADGWLMLRLKSAAWPNTAGHGRLEYGEPAEGGIAVRRLRFARAAEAGRSGVGASPTLVKPTVPTTQPPPVGRNRTAEFWAAHLALIGESARSGRRHRICALLGVDVGPYRRAVRRYGGRVLAAWTACQPEAETDPVVAATWLRAVDREIGRVRQQNAGEVALLPAGEAAAAAEDSPAEAAAAIAAQAAVVRREQVLARLGRDPSLYRAWVDRLGSPLRIVFDDCPAIDNLAEAQGWLDLVDRTIVEALLSGNVPSDALFCPVLGGGIFGLGWGPLRMMSGQLVRTLSGAGDAILLVPPTDWQNCLLEITFAGTVDPQKLLQVQASANRRDSVKQAVAIGDDDAKLRIWLDPSVSDFGLGWVAIRLSLDGTTFGISFWPLPANAAPHSDIAVRRIELRPAAEPDNAPALAPVGKVVRGARQGPDLPAAIHCVVPVWGREYLKTYLAAALPAHLTEGNLTALRRGTRLIYEIYTDAEGREHIEHHPLYPALQEAVDELVYFDVRDFRPRGRIDHQLTLNYTIMNGCHQMAIARASGHGGALLFLNCDTVYSDGCLARAWELLCNGYRTVENLSIRTDRDEMLAAFAPFYSPDGLLGIASAALTRLALPRLHWIARGRFWDGPPGLTIPDNLYWWVADTALLARATHFMPLLVFPRTQNIRYHGTIDHGFVPAAGIAESERWLMAAADEPSSFELSLTSHDQHFPAYERGSVRDLARFLSMQCEYQHLHNLQRPVRIAAEPVSEARWQEIAERSGRILSEARQRLKKYVLTPWRPDCVTEAEECALIWAPPLASAARQRTAPAAGGCPDAEASEAPIGPPRGIAAAAED
jgi:hypothetical protein